MGFIKPTPPLYDPLEWVKTPFAERSRLVCRTWALQGYGSPIAIYGLYVVKALLYIAGWWLAVSFTPGMGDPRTFSSWALTPVAFQKAILWSMLFEVLGLGCGSGPLTGRYFPPIGGFLYFLRPGTTKLPLFPSLPVLGGTRRTPLDVLLYAALLVLVGRALVAATPTVAMLAPIAVLLPVLGLADRTLFLCARGEHYWTTILVFVLAAGDWIPPAKAVHAALWFWAGVSKLNEHFPAVVCVMTSNSPFTRIEWLRKRMYRSFPDDLKPSWLAGIAHGGTLLEFAVPFLLVFGDGGLMTTIGLILMVLLHGFITSNFPMGVPIEWNIMMVYGGFFLFGANAGVSMLATPAPLGVFLVVMLLGIPLLGNLVPSRISFLLAMRYYAGNWAYSVWLFRGESYRKLDRLTKTSPWIHDQLARFYDRRTALGIIGRVMGFRLMHLHGRALPMLLPKAIERLEDYEWMDGEIVAGMVLGWNFGDGHLHQEGLLRAVQEQCGFEDGELRCIFVESQPILRGPLHYRIHDAKTGLRDEGHISTRELLDRQPWGS
jgi:hypothetical protein